MRQAIFLKAAAVATAMGFLAGCAAKTELQKARDDTAAAMSIAAEAETTAAAAAERADKAASQAGQARQAANAAASRSVSAAAPVESAPARAVAAPAQPAVAPAEPVAVSPEPTVSPAVAAPAEPVVTPAEPAEPAAAGDAVAGKNKARRCMACHSFAADGGHKMGPNLFGISGKAAGTAAGFNFSSGLKNAGFSWDAEKLAAWVCDSKAAIKELTGNADARTTMANQRICGSDAANVAAYLETLK